MSGQEKDEKEALCDEVGAALDSGSIGSIVSKHEKLIVKYYTDVQDQAKRSFNTANQAAKIGFGVLIVTLAYALTFDALHRLGHAPAMSDTSLTVSQMGLISAGLIEFIAAVSFWLYSRGARQFSAFHICLERMNRYLVGYKMAEQLGAKKDETLHDLVCIMANAPMISLDKVNPRGSSSEAKITPA